MASHIASFGELLAMPGDELRKELAQQKALVRKMRLGIHLNKEKDTAKYRREKRSLARMLTAQLALARGAKPAVKTESTKKLKQKPKTGKLASPSNS
jgi:ribosomal protein L29